MRRLLNIFVAVSSGLILCLPGSHPSAMANTLVSVQPANISTGLGSLLELTVNVTSVVDLFAFQFDVTFDSTVLSATGVSEGPFLPSGGATSFIPGSIDNATGEITFTADSLLGNVPGVTGDGTLATVTFSAVGVGTSTLGLENVLFLDSGLNDIAAEVTDGSVTVTPASSVPEPTIWPIIFLALTVTRLWHGSRSATPI